MSISKLPFDNLYVVTKENGDTHFCALRCLARGEFLKSLAFVDVMGYLIGMKMHLMKLANSSKKC